MSTPILRCEEFYMTHGKKSVKNVIIKTLCNQLPWLPFTCNTPISSLLRVFSYSVVFAWNELLLSTLVAGSLSSISFQFNKYLFLVWPSPGHLSRFLSFLQKNISFIAPCILELLFTCWHTYVMAT